MRALGYDKTCNYQIYANIDHYPIREAHESRIKNNPDFVYFQAIADRNKLFAERTHMSLKSKNEETRKAKTTNGAEFGK